jgi:hypothetical protein
VHEGFNRLHNQDLNGRVGFERGQAAGFVAPRLVGPTQNSMPIILEWSQAGGIGEHKWLKIAYIKLATGESVTDIVKLSLPFEFK